MAANKNYILLVAFCIIIFTPLTTELFFSEKSEKAQSNLKTITDSLRFELSSLQKFSKSYEEYFDKNFEWRKDLIKSFYFFKLFILKEEFPTEKIVSGTNGWFYYSGNNDGYGLEEFQGKISLSQAELEKIKTNLEEQKNWLDKREVKYLIVICPNKQTIYPEYFPEIGRVKNSVLDQILEYLKNHSTIQILDLRPPLLEAKSRLKNQLYFRTDSHWNALGAYIGYSEIIKKISEYYPEVRPLSLEQFQIIEEDGPGRDLINIIGIQNFYHDQLIKMELINQSDTLQIKKIPSVVLFHDSFYGYMKRFFNLHFDTIHKRHHFWSSFDYGLIESEKPNLVIYQLVERYEGMLLRDNPKEILQ